MNDDASDFTARAEAADNASALQHFSQLSQSAEKDLAHGAEQPAAQPPSMQQLLGKLTEFDPNSFSDGPGPDAPSAGAARFNAATSAAPEPNHLEVSAVAADLQVLAQPESGPQAPTLFESSSPAGTEATTPLGSEQAVPVVAGQAIFHDPFADPPAASATVRVTSPVESPSRESDQSVGTEPARNPPRHAPTIDFAALKRTRSAALDKAKGAVGRMFGGDESAADQPTTESANYAEPTAATADRDTQGEHETPQPLGNGPSRPWVAALDQWSRQLAGHSPLLLQTLGVAGLLMTLNAVLIVSLAIFGWI